MTPLNRVLSSSWVHLQAQQESSCLSHYLWSSWLLGKSIDWSAGYLGWLWAPYQHGCLDCLRCQAHIAQSAAQGLRSAMNSARCFSSAQCWQESEFQATLGTAETVHLGSGEAQRDHYDSGSDTQGIQAGEALCWNLLWLLSGHWSHSHTALVSEANANLKSVHQASCIGLKIQSNCKTSLETSTLADSPSLRAKGTPEAGSDCLVKWALAEPWSACASPWKQYWARQARWLDWSC